MVYKKVAPRKENRNIIQHYWFVDSLDNQQIQTQKIIPDGYPEMIFHLGDPYEINISGQWERQGKNLIAGQIRNSFHLRNTGHSKMFAIKFQPWFLFDWLNLDMSALKNQVIDMTPDILKMVAEIRTIALSNQTFDEKVNLIESWLISNFEAYNGSVPNGQKAVADILKKNGVINLKEIQASSGISERSLERYFKTRIGLSPKFYTRIIRFAYIFKLVQEKNKKWADVVYQSGFYDQSHFIKNFKEFTGEDPGNYDFLQQNLANLFLRE